MATTGLGLALSGLNHLLEPGAPPPKDYGSWPDILGYGGLTLIGTGIVLFILSNKNKNKSKRFVGTKNIVLPDIGLKLKNWVSTGVVINFY